MKIVKANEGGWCEVANLETSLIFYFENSRFVFTVDSQVRAKKIIISLRKIRLKESKPYCGSHPGPCIIEGRKRKAVFLEGLDWIEFNDILNNWADALPLEADISSSVCAIRIGRKRRMDYRGHNEGTKQAEWDKYGEKYEDYCGKVSPPCPHLQLGNT